MDPEFNKYKELLDLQYKQAEQIQQSLVMFLQNIIGKSPCSLKAEESSNKHALKQASHSQLSA